MPLDPHNEELTRATAAFEHAAIKPLYFLNGGALVAVLAFAGKCPGMALGIRYAMLCWLLGLIFATLTTFAGYFSQHSFYKAYNVNELGETVYDKGWTDLGLRARWAAYVFGVLSLAAFGWGAWDAIGVFGKLAPLCEN